MNRRAFLKFCGVVAASLYATRMAIGSEVVEIREVGEYPDFDPRKEYGDYVVLNDEEAFRKDAHIRRQIFEIVERDMRFTIPPEYRSRVTYSFDGPVPTTYDPLVELFYLRWRYAP